MHRHEYLERAQRDFRKALELAKPLGSQEQWAQIAGVLLLAARLEQLEDAMTAGLQTAGEGI